MQVVLLSEPEREHRVAQRRRRQRALHHAVHRRHDDARPAERHAAQRVQPLLLKAVGGGNAVAQLPFAGKERHTFLSCQGGEVRGHAPRLLLVGAEDGKGALCFLPQRRTEHRAVYAAHAADRRRPRAEADDLLQLPQLRQRHHLPVQLLHECPLLFRRNAQKGADRPRSDGLYPHTSFSMFS